ASGSALAPAWPSGPPADARGLLGVPPVLPWPPPAGAPPPAPWPLGPAPPPAWPPRGAAPSPVRPAPPALAPGVTVPAPSTAGGASTSRLALAPAGIWQPAVNTSWQIQYTGTLDQTVDAELYDIDLFDQDASVVAALQAKGRRVICYINV